MEKVGKSRPQDDRPISRLLLEDRGPKTWVAGWQGGIAIRKVFVRNPCNCTGTFPDHLENFQKVQKVQKFPKVARSGPSSQSGPNSQSGPKWPKSGPKWPKVAQTGPKWSRPSERTCGWTKVPKILASRHSPQNFKSKFFWDTL